MNSWLRGLQYETDRPRPARVHTPAGPRLVVSRSAYPRGTCRQSERTVTYEAPAVEDRQPIQAQLEPGVSPRRKT